MAYVPRHDDWQRSWGNYCPAPVPGIVVHAQKHNKRPVGFAPWPDETGKKRKKKKARRADGVG
jgi:hypothetical protein